MESNFSRKLSVFRFLEDALTNDVLFGILGNISTTVHRKALLLKAFCEIFHRGSQLITATSKAKCLIVL